MNVLNGPLGRRVRTNVRNRLASGLLVLVPVGMTLLVLGWVFDIVARLLQPVAQAFALALANVLGRPEITPVWVRGAVLVASVLGLLGVLYAVGAAGQRMLGQRAIGAVDRLLLRIPFARVIYGASKQVVEAVALPERGAFKSVVLLEYPRRGLWALGFLAGRIDGAEGRSMCKVFVPTTPNPTSGFFALVPCEEMHVTTLTVEEAFKMIISGGIIAPESFTLAGPAAAPPVGARWREEPAADGSRPAAPEAPVGGRGVSA